MAMLDVRFGLLAPPLMEASDAGGQELPMLGEPRAAVSRFEGESPAHPAVVDLPRELATRIGDDNPAAGLPGPLGKLIASGEPRADARAVALVPPAGFADRAPLAHVGHIGHKLIQLVRWHGYGNRLGHLQIGHIRSLP